MVGIFIPEKSANTVNQDSLFVPNPQLPFREPVIEYFFCIPQSEYKQQLE